jgi:mycothiol synthase
MRAPRHEDAEAVVTLLRACDVAIFGEPDTEIADVRDDWTAPGFDLARDAWMIQRADGTAVGYAWFRRRAGLDFDSDLRVLPGEPLDSLALTMLEAVEARTLETAAGKGALLCFFTGSVETELRALLERSGYREARTFFRMRIDLPERDEGRASLVPGIEIRPLRLGTDDRAIHAAIEESFAEHFRHTPRDFEEWWALRARHERFDPGLWLLAWDKDRVAGALVAFDYGDIGFVRELGVLKPWRGRGLGSALLARSFETLRAKGQHRVALGVDAENEGAVGLYVRLGMRVDSRHHLMQRSIGA